MNNVNPLPLSSHSRMLTQSNNSYFIHVVLPCLKVKVDKCAIWP